MVEANPVEKPEEDAFKVMDDDSDEDGSDDMDLEPDSNLLTMQKQLSIPRVQISEVAEGGQEEKLHLEVDGNKLGEVVDSPLLIGMMSSGAEDRMFKKMSMESPGLKPGTE